MEINTNTDKINELLTRGVVEVVHKESLRKKLESGKQLRIKLGIDPTSPDIHLGRSVPILKLRDFQKLGHQIVFIVGDFTGVIGDTSDKGSERPALTQNDINKNKKTYYNQIAKILDIEKVEFCNNSDWLSSLTYKEIGEHASQFSVADFIARDNIKKRLSAGKRVSLREVLYPLLQGYDSVAVKSDVEIGGTDQRFNLLAGRSLQEHFGQEPQDIVMGELINGLDGRKMSSSWGNTITITSEPNDMYGKIMSMSDDEMLIYFKVCTRIPISKIVEIEKKLNSGDNPKDIKMYLARELVTMYCGEKNAELAEEYFVQTFQKRKAPENIIEIKPNYVEGLIKNKIIKSKTELKRLLEAGGVKDVKSGNKLSEIPSSVIEPLVLKIGKRRFVKLIT